MGTNMVHCRSRRLFALAALVFLSTVLLRPADAADAVADAKAMLVAGDNAAAISTLEVYLQDNPKDQDARFTRALALARAKRNAEAIKEFSALAVELPTSAEPLNNLAAIYASQGDIIKAHAALESALLRDPNSFRARINLGDVYLALAAIEYRRALALDGTSSTAQGRVEGVGRLQQRMAGSGSGAPVADDAVPSASGSPVPSSKLSSQELDSSPSSVVVSAWTASAAGPADASDMQAQARALLQAWAQAWSDKNVDGYLGFYAPDFKPAGDIGRGQWEAMRRERIVKSGGISVRVENPVVTRLDAHRIQVAFVQEYRSASLSEKTNKIVQLSDESGSWKICRENAGEVAGKPVPVASVRPALPAAENAAVPPQVPAAPVAAVPVQSDAVGGAAAAKPVDTAAATRSPPGSTVEPAKQSVAKVDQNALVELLKKWVQASAQGDAKAYLALYSSNFQPPGGTSRGKWLEQTRQYLATAKRSKLTVKNLRWTQVKDGVVLEFQQDIQDGASVQHLTKAMQLIPVGNGNWQIMREIQK